MARKPPVTVDDLESLRALVHDLDFVRGRARGLIYTINRALDLDLQLALDLAHDLVREVDFAYNRPLVRTRDRDLDLDRAHDLAHDLVRGLTLDPDRMLPRTLGRISEVVELVEGCHARVDRLLSSHQDLVTKAAGQQAGEPAARPPGRTVRGLAVVACKMLPTPVQARYAQEFYSELFDMPRRHRLSHVFRLVYTAPSIRTSLRATPVRGGAQP